jgi:group II intron reverse transcriptase/maturase
LTSKRFFDSVPHDLLLKAVAHHTDERWVLLYIGRWLTAPMQMPDGTQRAREKGTPQGSPISPLLANLFMHYAFDTWMVREYPGCPFERYADDIVAHCDSQDQARALQAAIAERLQTLGLRLHPEKTKIAYCKDANRPGNAEHTSFDFLGYTFRARLARGRRGFFASFAPAISAKAKKAVGQKVRAWHLNRRSGTDLSGLATEINPQMRGWIGYYGAFYRSELYSLAWRVDQHLLRWAMQKFKRLHGKIAKASAWLDTVRRHLPRLFAHWYLLKPPAGRPVGAV